MAPASGSQRLKQRALALAQPLAANLELTYRCNWRCVFCYNRRHGDLSPLTLAEWIAVMDDLRRLGTLRLLLTGGEPLAHPSFFELAEAARERAFAVLVFTNGALIDEKAADGLARLDPVVVEMSIHGASAATHDSATGTPGSHDALLLGLRRLLARGVRVALKTPLTHLCAPELAEMAALADRLGVPYHFDPVLTPRDGGDTSPLAHAPTAEDLEAAYGILASRGPLPVTQREPGGLNCGLGRITLTVDPEGNVYPCMQWRASTLGNVREQRLADLWPTSSVREEAADAARAANDALLGAGTALAEFPYCPALALALTGDPATPDDGHRQRAAIVAALRCSQAASQPQ